jgi:xylulokinase
MRDLFLGLDLGTSGCKLIAFDREGRAVGRAARSYRQKIEDEIFHTLDLEAVWAHAVACFEELDALSLNGRVRTLAISALGEAFVLVDRAGKPLHPAPVSTDMRGLSAMTALNRQLGAEHVARLTGHPPSPIHSIYKLMWMKKHTPEILRDGRLCLCFHGYALTQLGLPAAIDRSFAARLMLLDVETDRWSPALLDAAGLCEDQLPPVVQSGTPLGAIPDAVASALRLPSGVEVVAGAHDQPMGALGSGVIAPGMAMYSIGTTECLVVPLGELDTDLALSNFPVYAHAAHGLYITLIGSQSGGRVLAWLQDIMGREGQEIGALLAEAAPIRDTSPLLLAHFSGSGTVLNDATSRAAIHGLGLETTRGDLVASFLEGITLEQAISLDHLIEATGPLEEIRAIGGGTRSDGWLQMKADILGCRVTRMVVDDAPCLAGAILGRAALEAEGDVRAAVADMVRTGASFTPRPERQALHARRKAAYAELYGALRPFNPPAAGA